MSSVNLNDFEQYKIELNNTNFLFFEKYYKKELEQGFVQKVQFLNTDNNLLRIKIRQNKEMKDLIIGLGFTLITKLKTEAKENKGFPLILNNKLENKQIKNIVQLNMEKILKFEFLEFNLYCEFFSRNNIILTDKDDTIIISLIKEEWKDRKIAQKQKYVLPQNDFGNILNYVSKEEDIDKEKNLISNVIKNVSISPVLIEQIILHNKLDKEKYVFKDYKKVVDYLKEIYSKPIINKTKYFVFKDKLCLFSLDVPFFDEINCPLNDILDILFLKKEIYFCENKSFDQFEKEKKHLQSIIDQQIKAKEKIETKALIAKQNAEFIYSNFEILEIIKELYMTKINKKQNIIEFEKKLNNVNKKFNKQFKFKKEEKEKRKIILSY